MAKWTTLASKTIFDSPFFTVKKDEIKLPDGTKKDWTYWSATDSTLVVAVESNKFIMIKQYRYLTKKVQLEFPSGALHEKELPTTAAKREFQEETGLKCGKIYKLGSFYESCSQFTRKNHMFITFDISKGVQSLDRGEAGFEDIRKIEKIPIKQAYDLAMKSKIESLPSSYAVLIAFNFIKNRGLFA